MTDRAVYLKHRKEGLPAVQAKRCADLEVRSPKIEWASRTGDRSGRTHLSARFKREGFEVFVTVRYDDDADSCLRGRFVPHMMPGAVRNPNARHDRDVMGWFLPDNSYQDHYSGLRGKGYHLGRHEAHTLARKYVLKDLRWALGCGVDWSPCYIEAKAYRAGVELGSTSMGGYTTAEGKESLAWEAEDITAEAIAEAQEALDRLCSCRDAAEAL